MHVRVWELAEELHVSTADVLALIEPYDAYVTSHLANVPRQALDALRASPPEPAPSRIGHPSGVPTLRVEPAAVDITTGPGPGSRAPARRRRRRPGPKPISFEPPYEEDDYGYGNDPTDELRYEPVWSTSDVARFYRVKPATVRQWVRRGHLKPSGTAGPSQIFNRNDVLAAGRAISARRKAPGQPDPTRRHPTPTPVETPSRRGLDLRALQRLAAVTPHALVSTTEVATMLELTPGTIRAWVRRGHLRAATPDAPHASRQLHFRIADVYAAATRR